MNAVSDEKSLEQEGAKTGTSNALEAVAVALLPMAGLLFSYSQTPEQFVHNMSTTPMLVVLAVVFAWSVLGGFLYYKFPNRMVRVNIIFVFGGTAALACCLMSSVATIVGAMVL